MEIYQNIRCRLRLDRTSTDSLFLSEIFHSVSTEFALNTVESAPLIYLAAFFSIVQFREIPAIQTSYAICPTYKLG